MLVPNGSHTQGGSETEFGVGSVVVREREKEKGREREKQQERVGLCEKSEAQPERSILEDLIRKHDRFT